MRRGGAQRQRAPVEAFSRGSVLPHQRRKSTKVRIETTRAPMANRVVRGRSR